MPLPRITDLAHHLVSKVLREGDHAVDATAGNGHDTVFLAGLVGNSGRIDSFDVQARAIESTRLRVTGLPQVRLHRTSHEQMGTVIAGPVRTVMFNLGYLPSGDRELATRPDTTIAALDASANLIGPGGLLSVVVYPGHEGGSAESLLVDAWFTRLSRERYKVWRCGEWPPAGGSVKPGENPSPYLLAAERRRER